MKKLLFTIGIITSFIIQSFSQSSEAIGYQSIVRDLQGRPLVNTTISFQFSILQGSTSGTAIYVENHSVTTNDFGLVTLKIGKGTPVTGTFSSIDWSLGSYFNKIEADITGGSNYEEVGTSEMLTVPYALHAKTADNGFSGDYNDLTNKPIIPEDNQALSITDNNLTISNGNTITLPIGSSGSSVVPVLTTTEITALTPDNGQAVFNSTENLYQIYTGSQWVSLPATCWPQPTEASAGASQIFSDGTVSTTLQANTPEVGHGSGEWTIVRGEGGGFDDATSPTALFTGQLLQFYTLKWSISTDCNVSEAWVRINFEQNGLGEQITDANGNIYNTVWIGKQNWMTENLKTAKYNDGTDIPNVTDNTEWLGLSTPAYVWYDNDEVSYKATYGALYNWYAVDVASNGGKNLCPVGWHVPTDTDWTMLTDYVASNGYSGNEGTTLKATSGWHSDGNGIDIYGFTALPGGSRSDNDGSFFFAGSNGIWWSSTERSSSNAWYRFLRYDYVNVLHDNIAKQAGFSVRCLKD